MYISTIKDGINTVHKNYQLIFIHLVSVILSCASFFVIVGIPVAIAFIMFGVDFTEIMRIKDIAEIPQGIAGLLSKYFGVALIIVLGLILYIIFVIALWVFTFSGTIGILAASITESAFPESHRLSGNAGVRRFTLNLFFTEGKRLFLPVFFFLVVIGSVFAIIMALLSIIGGAASAVIESAKSYDATLALFLSIFFALIILSAGIFLILAILSVTTYGFAYLAFNRSGPFHTLQETVRYLYKTPSSIGFYTLLIAGYLLIGFIVVLIAYPFALIPVIGPLLSLPYQLLSYIIQGYLNLILLASVFRFYYSSGYSSSPLSSTVDSGISLSSGQGQFHAPDGTAGSQQV
jgi:hypothetical protein